VVERTLTERADDVQARLARSDPGATRAGEQRGPRAGDRVARAQRIAGPEAGRRAAVAVTRNRRAPRGAPVAEDHEGVCVIEARGFRSRSRRRREDAHGRLEGRPHPAENGGDRDHSG
jgi:hypothetical protein